MNFRLLSAFLFAILVSACAVNPVTGQRQLSLVSEQQEIALGTQQYQLSIQQQGGKYHTDERVSQYIAEVGNRLAELSHKPELPYEFTVINSSIPNAWALPGGKIAFNRGLLTMLEDEAQLAAVLGHEIVHVTARHGAQGMSRGILLELGATAAGVLSGGGDIVSSGIRAGGGLVMASYSREQELEADLFGTEYMSKAGYNPQASVELQAKLLSLSAGRGENTLAALFASHPPSDERMQRNQETANKLSGSNRNKQRFQQELATLFKDKKAYENYDKAMQLRDEKKYQQALELVNQSIKSQPKEGIFWELKGDLLSVDKKNQEALKAYDTAVKVNPEFFQHYLARGIALNADQQYAKAEQDLQKANQLMPSRVGVFFLGETYYHRSNYRQAQPLYNQLTGANDTWGQNAVKRLNDIAKKQNK